MKSLTSKNILCKKIEYFTFVLFFMFSASFITGCLGSTEDTLNDSSVKVLSTSNSFLELDFSVHNYKIKTVKEHGKTYSDVEFNGGVLLEKKGFASLPFLHASVQLPAAGSVHYEIVQEEYIDIPLDEQFLPSKGTIYRDQNPDHIIRSIDPGSYALDMYPENIVKMSEPYILRDVRGLNVYIHPFRYDALNKILRVYSKVRVSLEIHNETASINAMSRYPGSISREMKDVYNSMFINYGSRNSDRNIRLSFNNSIADSGDILVIYTSRDESAIAPYIQWKKEMGYRVYTQEVLTGTNVKSVIQEAYNDNNNLLYVQLVGDWADIKSDLGTSQQKPMDPMLGCVAGDDYYPDLIIGRFSAETPIHVTTQVDKAINYEKNPDMNGTWYKRALGLGSGEGPGDDGEIDYQHIDNIHNYRLKPTTYITTSRYTDGDSTSSSSDAVNNGVSIINYTGHGSHSNWVTTSFYNSDVQDLTNGEKLPIVFSVACLVGGFHLSTESFAEAWLRKENGGAVAALMSTISQPWTPPMRGQDYMNDLLSGGYDYSSNPGVGTSTDEGRTTFGSVSFNGLVLMYSENNSSSDRETIQSWTIFGDASLQIRTDRPKIISLSSLSVTAGLNFSAQVTSAGAGIQGARVALSQGDNVYSGYTDSSGYVNISHGLSSGPVKIVVSGFNLGTLVYDVSVGTGSNSPPEAGFSFSAEELQVQFADTSSDADGTIAGWLWKFGDGQTSTNQNPIHVYAIDGTYTVELIVTDNDGVSNSVMKSLTVGEIIELIPPEASFEYTADDFEVQFSDKSADDGTITYWLWDFGDGQTSTFANPVHTYAEEGTYVVELTVMDQDGLKGSFSQSINVIEILDPNEIVEKFTDVSIGAKEEDYYSFKVEPGTNFKVVMTGINDADLYVRYGAKPTSTYYDCRPFSHTSNEKCESIVPENVYTAYIMVTGFEASTYNLKVTYTKPEVIPDDSGDWSEGLAQYNFQSIVAGDFRYYQPVPVKAGTEIKVAISGTGDADVYVRFDAAPTKNAYDARPYLLGSNEEVLIEIPEGVSKVYVMVYGYDEASYDLNILYSYDEVLELISSFLEQTVIKNSRIYYGPFDLVPGEAYSVEMNGTGESDLYTAYNVMPDLDNYVCRPQLQGSNETCEINSVPEDAEKLFVMVNGLEPAEFSLLVRVGE